MAWRLFQWGSRGLWYETDVLGVYVAARFIPNTVRTVLGAQGPSGQQVLNTLHFFTAGIPSFGDCHIINEFVSSWWTGQYRQMVNGGFRMSTITTTGIDRFNSSQDVVPNTDPGLRSGTHWAPEQTLCVKASTHTSGRRYRGRCFPFPAVATDLQTDDRVTALYRNAIVGVFNNLLAIASAAGYPMVVASLVNRAPYLIAEWVAVDDALDTQRRRMLGQG